MTEITREGDGNAPPPYATATYNPAGQLLTLAYGAGTETRTYNSLNQLTGQSIPGLLNMAYGYSATQNNGRITTSTDYITGETTNYTYDALNRLTAASNSLWSQTYGYDGFGNLTSKSQANGSPNPSPAINVTYDANNHQNGVGYDANGNVNVGAPYSVENRMVSEWSGVEQYAYDPWGKRVMNGSNPDPYNLNDEWDPLYSYNFYGITGQKLATVTCNGQYYPQQWPTYSIVGQNVYFGSKLLISGGVPVVTDRLGSVRANTQGESFAYYPYGEERTNTADGREKFGTYFRDGVGQDYAEQRYYNGGMGRFGSPDTGGPAKLSIPLSWNRYAYAGGDPVNNADRHGTDRVLVCDGPDEEDQTCWWQFVCLPGGDCFYTTPPPPIPPGLDGTGTTTGPTDVGDEGPGPMTIPSSQVPGYGIAMDALADDPNCAAAVQKGGTAKSTQAGLNNETYVAWYPGIPSSGGDIAVAQTSGFTVDLNTTVFSDPEHVLVSTVTAAGVTFQTVNAVQLLVSLYNLNPALVTTSDFEAIILLHELGHSLGGLPSDATSLDQSVKNTGTIIDSCFSNLKM